MAQTSSSANPDEVARAPYKRVLAGRWWLLAIAALVVTGMAAWGVSGAPGRASKVPAKQAPIRLGLLLPLSGDSQTSGAAMRVAAQMAVDQVNAGGGVHGRPLELVTLDDACDPQTAVVAANKLVAEHVAVSVGGYCSSATLPTLPILHAAGIPMILPAANSDDLLTPGYDSVFLLNGTGGREATVALTWMRQLGGARVALVDDGTSYSANIANVAANHLRGGTGPAGLSLSLVLRVTQGAPRFTSAAATIRASGADVVYFTGYTAEAGRLARDLRSAGYEGIIMVADGCADPALVDFAQGNANGVYATTPPLAQDLTLPAWWEAEYQKRAGAPPGPYTVQASDAVTVAADALRRAPAGADGSTIALAISATHGLHLLSGTGAFDAQHILAGFTFTLRRVESGRFVLIRIGDTSVATGSA